MSILGEENTLPGVSIEIIEEYDSTSFDTSEWGTTESVLVIGTAFDGPTGKEVAIYNPEHAQYIFGGTYDSSARREATLVAGITDAYKAGCRTIYAMRVGGEEISKTFKLRENGDILLKVSGIFPSNKNKDIYFLLDLDNQNGETLTIYKPASRATIVEKKQGLVEDAESVLSLAIDLNTYGINKATQLTDFINTFNNHSNNNVFKLTLVNHENVDITNTEVVQGLTLGSLFSGLYTIGRDKNVNEGETVVTSEYAENNVPYEGFQGGALFTLSSNTDINAPYPITLSKNELYLLTTPNGLNTKFTKDTKDYEGVRINNFELYKALGSGYAKTAVLKNGRVKPATGANSIVHIGDGIYSIAANLKSDYRVLTCANADTKIRGKMPKKEDFKKISVVDLTLLANNNKTFIYATSKDTTTSKPIKYQFAVTNVSEETFENLPKLETLLNTPVTCNVAADSGVGLIEQLGIFYVTQEGKTIASLKELQERNEDALFTSITKTDDTYQINILSTAYSYTTLEEFIDLLNNSELSQLFTFSLGSDIDKTLYVADVLEQTTQDEESILGYTSDAQVDRSDAYAEGLCIPYTTTDTFARQLAQHCTYTSIKTYATHGVIGVTPIIDTSIKAVQEQANALNNLTLDLYVKNNFGKNVLDKDNLPYHIGKDLSIVTEQHVLATLDGYNYISNGAAAYAGMVSALPTDQSSTHQPINVKPQFTYSQSQLMQLNNKGFVTVHLSPDEQYVITDGITCAETLSSYKRLASIRAVKLIDKIIRSVTEPYIGKKNNNANRNSMQTAIKSGLDVLLETYIEKYSFRLLYDTSTTLLSSIDIEYYVKLVGEIRDIHNVVTAKNNL